MLRRSGLLMRRRYRAFVIAQRQNAPPAHRYSGRLAPINPARRQSAPGAIADGFGSDAAGEDRFDSLIGVLGLIGVIDGWRPDFIPPDPMIRHWEGWVLGQTALPKEAD